MITLQEYLKKLEKLIEQNRLHEVATELSQFFKKSSQSDFGLQEARKILDELAELSTDTDYETSPLLRDFRRGEIKSKLKTILSELGSHLNLDIKVNESHHIPSESEKEEFKGVANLEKGVEVITKGPKGTINQSFNGFLKIILVVGAIAIIILLIKHCMPTTQPKCDCTTFDKLEDLCKSKIKNWSEKEKEIDTLIKGNISKKQNENVIKEKEGFLTIKRSISQKLDSLNSIILPQIKSIQARCPRIDCKTEKANLETTITKF